MSDWASVKLKFSPFEALEPPLKSALTALEAAEAILEALLDLLKAFALDLINPLRALIALLLAAIRAIINQIKSTGFSILVVHPDFSRQDFGSILQSVSGSYPAFENKVISKIYDSADIFRPAYPPGSSVAMLVMYIGSDSAEQLLLQLFALLRLIKSPLILTALPRPVDLKVNPARQSGDPVANFRGLFDTDLKKALVVEWRMPSTPSGSNNPSFVNALTSVYNSFRFPKFIIERSTTPTGSPVEVKVTSQTIGGNIVSVAEKYGMPPQQTTAIVQDEDGGVFRNFPKKIDVSGSNLLSGAFAGTYRYTDEDPELVQGTAYFYRVRAYFGDASSYISTILGSDLEDRGLVKYNGTQPIIRYGNDTVVSPQSSVVRGFVPRNIGGFYNFNPYEAVYEAVQAALLLNFELPVADFGDSVSLQDQKAGWGVIAAASGQIGPLKSIQIGMSSVSVSGNYSDKLKQDPIFLATSRRISNQSLSNLLSQPALMAVISGQWNDGVQEIVDKVLNSEMIWRFPVSIGGFTQNSQQVINDYLALESEYVQGQAAIDGPYPTFPYQFFGEQIEINPDDRRKLMEFLRSSLMGLAGSTSYLSWYSVTIGDLFPAFNPFMFDFEQWLLALLKAFESALQALTDIIETILEKIKALEIFLREILNLLDLLKVDVSLSILLFQSTNGSVDDLATALRVSENKPSSSPSGLHSGLVMTFGGPGEGSLAALNALKFILQIPS